MSTLKVNKIRDTAGSADSITLDPNGGAVIAGVTTVSTVKVGSGVTISSDGDVFTTGITTSSTVIVGSGVTISESGIEASGIGITVANINGGQFSNRNVIINGACRVAQRSNLATSQTGYGAVDRFQLLSTGDSRFTLSKNDGPGAQYGLPSALKFETTTADSSVAATDYMYLDTRLEGQDLQRFQKGSSDAKQFTLQFWIKLAVTGTYVVQLFDADNSRHVVANYTVSSANTWEKKIITFPADTTGSFDNDNARSLDIRWHFMGGSNYRGGTQQTTWGSIVATNMLEGMGNAVSSTGDNFITGMQLEVGPQATAFEHRSIGEELALCRRYYRVFQDASGGACYMGAVSYNYDVNSVVTQVNFSPEMRATPSLDNTSGTNYYRFYRNSGYVDINAMNAINGMTKYGGGFNNSDSGSGTAGQTGGISLNNTSAKIAFDAEL
jgi:hypothetical protein